MIRRDWLTPPILAKETVVLLLNNGWSGYQPWTATRTVMVREQDIAGSLDDFSENFIRPVVFSMFHGDRKPGSTKNPWLKFESYRGYECATYLKGNHIGDIDVTFTVNVPAETRFDRFYYWLGGEGELAA